MHIYINIGIIIFLIFDRYRSNILWVVKMDHEQIKSILFFYTILSLCISNETIIIIII